MGKKNLQTKQLTEMDKNIYLQNIPTVQAAQYQKNKQGNKKSGWQIRHKTFLQRRRKDGQQTHEKMLNTIHYQRNANQNYNEVPPHTSKNDYHQKNLQTVNAGEDVVKREALCTVGGDINWYNCYGEQYRGFLKN